MPRCRGLAHRRHESRRPRPASRSTTATRAPAASKASAISRPMPPARAGEQHRLSLDASVEIESHRRLLSLPPLRRRDDRLLLDEARLRLAYEFLAVLGEHAKRRARSRRPSARPRRCRTTIRRRRPSAPPPGFQLCTRPKRRPRTPGICRTMSACGPVQWAKNSSSLIPGLRRTKLMRLIMQPFSFWRRLEKLERDAVVDAQIRGLGAPCSGRRRSSTGPSGTIGRAPQATAWRQRRSASSTARQRCTLPGLAVRLGILRLARYLVVEQLERIAARQVDEGGVDRDAGIADDDGRDRACRARSASAPALPRTAPRTPVRRRGRRRSCRCDGRLCDAGCGHAARLRCGKCVRHCPRTS